MTDGKEWVTIKIPKDTRDDAKDDPRTYEEIMRSGLGQSESHADQDVEEIVEELKNEISMANDPGVDVDTEKLMGRIDDLESSIPNKTADELMGRINR